MLIRRDELLECAVDSGNRIVRIELAVPNERIDNLEGRGMLTSGCAGGLFFSAEAALSPRQRDEEPFQVPCSAILKRMNELDTHRGVYTA